MAAMGQGEVFMHSCRFMTPMSHCAVETGVTLGARGFR